MNRTPRWAVGSLLLLLVWHTAPVLAQEQAPFQLRVTGGCAVGSSIRQINLDGTVVCQSAVTSVDTGSGLTGGPITTSGTISIAPGGVTSAHIADGTVAAVDVNSAQVQLRVTGTCSPGRAIQAVRENGTVSCQSVGGEAVTAVTASAPLISSGGTTPNISLPNVIIEATNTAIGSSALFNDTTGERNTASGAGALSSNTTGFSNTASGVSALQSNSTGFFNTASGFSALELNTTGGGNTASGVFALESNTTGGDNTATGVSALESNTTGGGNTASGVFALINNATGGDNTATGVSALANNTTGAKNTAVGSGADVSLGGLTNATAIGAGATVDASNKIRLGNAEVTVVEGPPYSVVSDKAKKENFQPVDGEGALGKIRSLTLTSWNFIGQDPRQSRHYGPVAQEFFAAFGHDGIGTIGTPTTITSTDMAGVLMIAVQALEERTAVLQQEKERLKEAVEASKAENAELRARLEAVEKRTFAKEALAQK